MENKIDYESDSESEVEDYTIMPKVGLQVSKLEVPVEVQKIISKIEQAQLLRTREEISSQLNDILQNVQRIIHRYTFDESIQFGKKIPFLEYKQRRLNVLEKMDYCANSADIKGKTLMYILAWLQEWHVILSDMTATDVDDHHYVSQMKILPETFKSIEGNVKRLSVMSTSLLEEKKKKLGKRTPRKSLWKSWKDRVLKRPATAQALTPNQMISDEFATNTKVSEINYMLQELIDTTMFNKLENNAINYIASTISNLSKALTSLNNEVKVTNLSPDVYISEEGGRETSLQVIKELSEENEMLQQKLKYAEEKCEQLIKFKAWPSSTLKVLSGISPQSPKGFRQTDKEESIDNILIKEYKNTLGKAQRKGTKGSVFKWDSAISHTSQVEMTAGLIDQQSSLPEKPPKISSKDITEDKISLKEDWTDEYQSQERKISKASYELETSRSSLTNQTSKQIVSETKGLQVEQKTSQEVQLLSVDKSKSFIGSKSQRVLLKFPSTDTKSQGGKSRTSKWERLRKQKLAYIISKDQVISGHKKKSTTELMNKESKSLMSFQAESSGITQLDKSSEKVKIKEKEHQVSSEITTSKEGKTEEKDTSVFTKKVKSHELAESQSKITKETSESTTAPGSPDGKSEQDNLDEFHNAIMSFLKEKIDNTGTPLDKKTVPEGELLLKKAEVEKLGIIKTKMEEYFQNVAGAVAKILRKYKDIKKEQIREKQMKQKQGSFIPGLDLQRPISAKSEISSLLSSESMDPVIQNLTQEILTEIEKEEDAPVVAIAGKDHQEKKKQRQEKYLQVQGEILNMNLKQQQLQEERNLWKMKYEKISKRLEEKITWLQMKEGKQEQQKEKQWQKEVLVLLQKQRMQKQTEQDEMQKGMGEEEQQKQKQQPLEAWMQKMKEQEVSFEEIQKEVEHLELESSWKEEEEKQKPERKGEDDESQWPKKTKEQKKIKKEIPENLQNMLSYASITLTPRWKDTWKAAFQLQKKKEFLMKLADEKYFEPAIPSTLTQFSSPGPLSIPGQYPTKSLAVIHEEAEDQDFTLSPEQAQAQGIILSPEQAQAMGITVTPQQAQAQGISLTPEQAQRLGFIVTPEEAQALGITLRSQQLQVQGEGISLIPQQDRGLGAIVTPQQAETQQVTVIPEQAKELGFHRTPEQAQAQGIALTPQQAQALGITLTPQQAEELGITLTPQQAQELGITLTPQQALAQGINVTPQQAKALGITLTPQQALAQGITVTPQQAKALGITLTPQQALAQGITLTPQQAEALGITLTPQQAQAQAQGITLTPQQAEALGITLTPQQAQAQGITLTPQQAEELGITLTPQQAEELGITLTLQEAQAQAQGITLTPQQAQAQGITLTPQQAKELGITLTPQQAQAQGITVTPQQAEELGITLTPQQAQAQGITLTPQQAEELGITLTPQQAQAQGITVTPQQAEELGITLTTQQAQAQGITVTPQQAEELGITLTPQEAQAQGITLTPQQTQGITVTPQQARTQGITVTPRKARTRGITLTRQQAQALGIPLNSQKSWAQGITVTPQQAQALGIIFTRKQAQAQGITVTPRQAQALGITLTPEQAQAQRITLTPQLAQSLGFSLTPQQAQAQAQDQDQGITVTPRQAQALGITLTPQQAQGQDITLTHEQIKALMVTLTPEKSQELRVTLTHEQDQALRAPVILQQEGTLRDHITPTQGQTLKAPATSEQIQAMQIPVTTQQAQILGVPFTQGQDEALGVTVTPQQTEAQTRALMFTLTPEKAQISAITHTNEQALAEGIPLTPEQVQVLGIPLTLDQAQALETPLTAEQAWRLWGSITPEMVQEVSHTLSLKQSEALGITPTYEQAQSFGTPLLLNQAQALGIPIPLTLRPEQSQGVPLTSDKAHDLGSPPTHEQVQPLGAPFTPGQAQPMGTTHMSRQSLESRAPPINEQFSQVWAGPPSGQTLEGGIFSIPDKSIKRSAPYMPKLSTILTPSTPKPFQESKTSFLSGPATRRTSQKLLAPLPSSKQTLVSKGQFTPVQFLAPEVPPIPGKLPVSGTPPTPGQPLISGIPSTSSQIPSLWDPLFPGKPLIPWPSSVPGELTESGRSTFSEQPQAFQLPTTREQSPYLQAPSALGQLLAPRTLPGQAFPLWISPSPGYPSTLQAPSTLGKPPKDLFLKPKSELVHPSAPHFKVPQTPFTTKKFQISEVSDTSKEIQELQDSFAMEQLGTFQSYLTNYRTPVSQTPYTEGPLPARTKPITSLPPLTTQLPKRSQISPSEWDWKSRFPPISKPCVLTSVSDTKKLKMTIPSSSFQELKEQRYFVDVKAQRKNLILLNQTTETSGLPSELYTTARNLIIETLHTDTVRLGYLFRKYIAYRLIQRARNNIIKRLQAIQNSGKGYEIQDLYIMLNRIDGYQKKMMGVWTGKQKSLEQNRNQCLRKMMLLFSQLQDIYKLKLSQPVPLFIDKKQKPTPIKLIQQPFLDLPMKEDRKSDIFKKLRKQDQMEAIWNADQSASSYPITEKTSSIRSLWAQLGGYPPIPMLLQLDVQSTFRKSLASIQSQ
ncbi:protein FAM186A [Pipistrellus kuhlii]|uniref:protein FAM186A n=1 Tax=Pipistrellus kuhlii TaxID=59472 RepID=UPI00174F64C3|nr:protein FAM186A [Pipistrellus kuhlii]